MIRYKPLAKRLTSLLSPCTDIVIDIGAGTGVLTIPLAKQGWQSVWAVEIDPVFAEVLRTKTEPFANVRVLETDVLKMTWPKRPFCAVGNLPFSITTPVLRRLLDDPLSLFQEGVFIVEQGAAVRFCARMDDRPRLLTWRMYFAFERIDTVPAWHFSPPPGVDGAILRICRRPEPLVPVGEQAWFAALAAVALRMPEAPLKEALRGVFTVPQISRLARTLSTDRDASISSLNEQQWAIVYDTMRRYVPPARWPKPSIRRYDPR